MWRFGVALGSVLVLLLAVASVSDAKSRHRTPPRCPAGHPLVAADARAEVYEAFNPYGSLSIYGCAYNQRRSYTLGDPEECGGGGGGGGCAGIWTATLMLAGTDVAFWEESQRSAPLIVRDLRTGRVLHKLRMGTPPLIEPDAGYATAIVVKSDGAVAWIVGHEFVGPEGHGPPPVYEVEAADKTGRRLLATGSDIDFSSLALVGSTLYWTQGGKPVSASLN